MLDQRSHESGRLTTTSTRAARPHARAQRGVQKAAALALTHDACARCTPPTLSADEPASQAALTHSCSWCSALSSSPSVQCGISWNAQAQALQLLCAAHQTVNLRCIHARGFTTPQPVQVVLKQPLARQTSTMTVPHSPTLGTMRYPR